MSRHASASERIAQQLATLLGRYRGQLLVGVVDGCGCVEIVFSEHPDRGSLLSIWVDDRGPTSFAHGFVLAPEVRRRLRRRQRGRMSRPTLEQLRTLVLDEIGNEWITPTEVVRALNVAYDLRIDNNVGWGRVALVIERLANDGVLELKTPGSGIRRFRRRRP